MACCFWWGTLERGVGWLAASHEGLIEAAVATPKNEEQKYVQSHLQGGPLPDLRAVITRKNGLTIG